MTIAVFGCGRMGEWFARELASVHRVVVWDSDETRLARFAQDDRMSSPGDLSGLRPSLFLNCTTLSATEAVFREALPSLPEECILADIASLKSELPSFYAGARRRFVSIHPMFGPTFATLDNLRNEHAVVIGESDPGGKRFFLEFFASRGVSTREISFDEHDRLMAYSLTLPFAVALGFAGATDRRAVPGTTFRRQMAVSAGLLSEDDHLLAEILLNRYSLGRIDSLLAQISELRSAVAAGESGEIRAFLARVRDLLGRPEPPRGETPLR